ncbi:hypothetical protein IGI04_025104 [Brassica rapa subsp. trilocularis]|uniref:SHSP domain-containing protein n=1 Tax=Brassica rapa subsp. trilocularis TaxID=1813537 RepID=A0ABQ7MB35_BRACM|nr:hypothetical protein IGI04_025104 [Brassica rapa subsp. trilocularis]
MNKAGSSGGGPGYSHKDWPKHFPPIPRNQFQKSGNQSVYEVKETKTARVARIDTPGCTVSSLTYWIDGRNLHFFAGEPDMPEYGYDGRKYGGTMVFDPVAYDMEKARAKLVNGVLWITVPKIQRVNAKAVTIEKKVLNFKTTVDDMFQRYGPKGFMEIKVLRNDNLYVRVDLPGVPDDAIRYRVDAVRQKVVFFSGEETLRAGDKVDDVREYSGTAGLGCDCCEITGVEAKMKDGVLRMILSRVKVKDHDNKCSHFLPPNTGKSGRYDIGDSAIDMIEVEDHPFVVKGRKGTFTSARTSDGCYHFSVDLPGVSSDDIFVLPNENEFKFIAENKIVYEHDESCRIFIGAVNKRTCCSHGIPLLDHNIAWDAEFGVLKVRVSPPPLNNNDQ